MPIDFKKLSKKKQAERAAAAKAKKAPKAPSHGNVNPLGGWGDRPQNHPTPAKPKPPAPPLLSTKPLFAGQPPHKPSTLQPLANAIMARKPAPPPGFTPVYNKDHANPRAPHRVDPPGIQFELPLAPKPIRATHLRWSDGRTTVEVPVGHYGDFSSMKTGKVEWGIVRQPRGGWEMVSDEIGRISHIEARDEVNAKLHGGKVNEHAAQAQASDIARKPAPPGSKPLPPRPPVATSIKAPQKKEGVCAFIDGLIMQGGRTKQEIADLTCKQFPGRDPRATLTTVGIRPTHIKAKGQVPSPFKK